MTTPAPPAARRRSYPTASLAAQASLAQVFYSAQALLAAMATRDIIAIWQQLNLRDVRQSWPAIRAALAGLIETRFGMSAAQAGAYYAQARQAAGVSGPAPRFSLPPIPFPAAGRTAPPPPPGSLIPGVPPPVFPPPAAATPVPGPPVAEVPPPSPQLIQVTLDSTGPFGLLGRIQQGQPLERAMENTSVVMSGAASRLIQNGARQAVLAAVQADPQAVAWGRTTAANPCAWCAMLASRGFVYKSQASADFRAHNHCRCTAVPAWSQQDVEALRDNDLYQQWREVTRGHSKHEAVLAWRRYWDKQMSRDGIRVLPAA